LDETVGQTLDQRGQQMHNVYTQSNEAEQNEVIAFKRGGDGRLTHLARYPTGGKGSGKPHLASQSSIALNDDGSKLFVTNAGSDDALDADAQRVFGWTVEEDGSLTPVGSFNGLPATVAVLASS
jgi:6-phosphogluconolactonase (cycloisomerase 2 family)